MHKVTLPIEMNGFRYGIEFKRSVGYTDDERIALLCRSKGFDVELMESTTENTGGEESPASANKPQSDMTVAELKAFAAENGIDLAGKTKKDDILAAIRGAAGAGGEEGENLPTEDTGGEGAGNGA